MKLSWNKKSTSTKRSFSAVSKYPNLPFDKEDDPPREDPEDASASQNQERPASKALPLNEDGPSSSSSSPDHQQLARSFQSQGDKLAEVNHSSITLFFVSPFNFFCPFCFPEDSDGVLSKSNLTDMQNSSLLTHECFSLPTLSDLRSCLLGLCCFRHGSSKR